MQLCDYDIYAFGTDLDRARERTKDDCIQSCVDWSEEETTPCVGVTFDSNLTSSIGEQGGNCFLKRNASLDRINPSPDQSGTALSAVLLD